MTCELFLYSCLMLLGVFISSLSQVLLKKSANEKHQSYFQEYCNAKVITAYAMLLSATLISVIAFKVVPLSLGNILDAFGYVFITILSTTIFKEKITLKKLFAMALIASGTLVYTYFG